MATCKFRAFGNTNTAELMAPTRVGCFLSALILQAAHLLPGAAAQEPSTVASVVILPSGRALSVIVQNLEEERCECSIDLRAQTFAGSIFVGDYVITDHFAIESQKQNNVTYGIEEPYSSILGLAFKTANISVHCTFAEIPTYQDRPSRGSGGGGNGGKPQPRSRPSRGGN